MTGVGNTESRKATGKIGSERMKQILKHKMSVDIQFSKRMKSIQGIANRMRNNTGEKKGKNILSTVVDHKEIISLRGIS